MEPQTLFPTLIASARTLGEADYRPLEVGPLRFVLRPRGGRGTLTDPFFAEACVANAGDAPWRGVVHLRLPVPEKSRFFLPGVMYGWNRGEAPLRVDTAFPRLRPGPAAFPAAPGWMFRADRLSHPAAFAYGGGRLRGLCAPPYFVIRNGEKRPWMPGETGEFCQYAGFTCALEPGTVGCTLGYENAPWLFIQSHHVRDRAPLGENCFCLEPGEAVRLPLYLYDFPAGGPAAVYGAVEAVYRLYHQPPRQIGSAREAVADIASALARDAWLEKERSWSGFVFEHPEGREYRRLYSLSWTNGMTVAAPMLLAGLRLGDAEIRGQALSAIDYIVDHSVNPRNGLPYCAYQDGVWNNRGWWFDGMRTPGHSGYLVGQAVYELLRAWEAEKAAGTDHSAWLVWAAGVAARLASARNSDGEYPFVLSEETGAGLEYDALGGAWCLAAAAYCAFLTGDRRDLPGLAASEDHYFHTYIARAECWGGPLDTDKAVDAEGVLAYLRAVRRLHTLTGEEKYLDRLRAGLDYAFSFQFCYNSPIKTPPLSAVGWSSSGGSITSTANPHIHPMSVTVIDEMYYYLDHRQDAYVRSRLEDAALWCRQTYNRFDGEYGYGKKGWMSERFCHCEGLLVEKWPDGSPASTWFALMAWACGSVLEGLCGRRYDEEEP